MAEGGSHPRADKAFSRSVARAMLSPAGRGWVAASLLSPLAIHSPAAASHWPAHLRARGPTGQLEQVIRMLYSGEEGREWIWTDMSGAGHSQPWQPWRDESPGPL